MNRLYLIFLLLFASCADNQQQSINGPSTNSNLKTETTHPELGENQNFAGSWYWQNEDLSSSFKIILHQEKDSLYGQYCAAYDHGNRLDCDFDTVYNINGHIVNGGANINFDSFFGATGGTGILEIKNEKLQWHITKYPTNGDCFAPKNAELQRKPIW